MKIREAHKVVVMGAGGVGKTSLVVQFMEGFFSSAYKPTVEDYYRHTIQLPDGMYHTVEILDTSGTHYFPAMRELSIRSGRAFILVFSVDSLQSFHEVVAIWETVMKIRGNYGNIPTVLVGNKSDLNDERQVPYELIEQTKVQHMNNCPYIETSAKLNKNVARLFMELLQQARSLDGTSTPELKRHRKLSRRLSSFGSLPNINLIRRKSSGNSAKMKNGSDKNGNKERNGASDTNTMMAVNNRTLNGLKGINNPITGSLNGVNKLVDNDMLEIKRAIINGMDTISLCDGSKTPPDQKCSIL
ncbi:GTP-binding protein Di-Ras2 [Halotydeus destructor]|nr:GTP-binding protein Di-Ras2 [Halotydeus destructor]